MQSLGNVATQDKFVAALTLEQDTADTVSFLIANASAVAQFRPFARRGEAAAPYGPEILLPPQTNTIRRVSGVRFRSAEAGKPAQIVAQLTGPEDPEVTGGTPYSQFLSSTGAVSNIVNVPTGGIIPYAGAVAPTGFVLCDGAHYDGTQAVNAALWNLIGLTYGGTSQADFAVPDLRGRVPVGLGTNASVNARGQNEGAAVASRRPHHRTSLADPTHSHTYGVQSAATGAGPSSAQGVGAGPNVNLATSASGTGITVGTGVGTDPLDTPAFEVVNFIIAL